MQVIVTALCSPGTSLARVITKGSREPSPIVGDFVNYLLGRHSKRIKAITTAIVK